MQDSEPTISISQPEEQEFRRYVNLSIEWNRWLLKPIGAWPHSLNISWIEKCFTWLVHVVCYGLISFIFIPCTLHTILDVEDTYNKIKSFGPLSFCVMNFIKYYSLIFHVNDIRKCIKYIEWDWRNIKHVEDRSIMVANANFAKRLVKFCTFFVGGSFVFYHIVVPINVGKVVDENLTFIPMVWPCSRLIVDTRHSPVNEIFLSIQVLAGLVIHTIAAGTCGLIAAFSVHVCGQIKVLMCWIRYLVDGRSDMCKTVDGRIASIVCHHVRILKCVALIEKTTTQISLVEVSGSTLGICLLGYYIIMEWKANDLAASATYSVILVSYLFNIFIFCYIGELVAELCRSIGEMSYTIEWYRLPRRRRPGVILIIAMSNATMKLTAGGMIKLCFTSFSDVVKTSVAFLNMLRTLA
ncbi:odorant receptor 22c-like [Hylaeus anthracinus]|uniref:odorant receptor 22c-like n=1 Tax=Hylaeus anthracinus TaxID=313031 RepID=UPI0023B96536|nr:odorant receptor 22c-like [Hylaeus anthracinus]